MVVFPSRHQETWSCGIFVAMLSIFCNTLVSCGQWITSFSLESQPLLKSDVLTPKMFRSLLLSFGVPRVAFLNQTIFLYSALFFFKLNRFFNRF